MVENKIKKRVFFTDYVENKGYNFKFPSGENKIVACPSPKDIYIDSPVQAKRSSGLENTHHLRELRSSTRYGVEGKRKCLFTPSCASLAWGYPCKSPFGDGKE